MRADLAARAAAHALVDRELALPAAERALAIALEHPGNQVLYAMTQLDLYPARAKEALAILERVAAAAGFCCGGLRAA